MANFFMVGARLIQAIQALNPRFTGKEQDNLLGLADAAAGAAYDAAFDHIEVLQDFRTDMQGTEGASLIGTTTVGAANVQEALDDLRTDLNAVGGGPGAGYALDADVVHKTGAVAESITGPKTFTSDVKVDVVGAKVEVGSSATMVGGVTAIGSATLGVYANTPGTVISIRPEGRTSTTNAVDIGGGTITINGIELGYRNLERTTTFDANARGKMAAVATNITVSTGSAAGTTFSIYNNSAASIQVIQDTGLTLRLAGTTNTGNRTLAARGMATIWFNSTTEAIISGAGVT